MTSEPKPVKVFISYSHDSQERLDRVPALSDRMRREGIDRILDQYETSPPEGWQRWMERQVMKADYALLDELLAEAAKQ